MRVNAQQPILRRSTLSLSAPVSPRLPTVSPTLQPDRSTRDISHLAVWRVSTAKQGNGTTLLLLLVFSPYTNKQNIQIQAGAKMLRDGREDTYWQSDGAQPHTIILEFQRLVTLSGIALFVDYKLDESYTPQRISVRTGTRETNVKEIRQVELKEPQGWVLIPLTHPDTQLPYIKAFRMEVVILANHQNGRDTHVRQLRVFGPRTDQVKALGFPISFTSLEFNQVAFVR